MRKLGLRWASVSGRGPPAVLRSLTSSNSLAESTDTSLTRYPALDLARSVLRPDQTDETALANSYHVSRFDWDGRLVSGDGHLAARPAD